MFSLILDRLGSIVVQSVDEGLSFITFFYNLFFFSTADMGLPELSIILQDFLRMVDD